LLFILFIPIMNSRNFSRILSSFSRFSSQHRGRISLLAAAPLLMAASGYNSADELTTIGPSSPSPSLTSLSTSKISIPPPTTALRMSLDSEEFGAGLSETRLCAGISVIPHPAKRAKGGEDAYFFSSDMNVAGIADGVGGWADLGVDPAVYSRSLMEGARLEAEHSRDPLEIMSAGYTHSAEVTGSSTCCICVLDGHVLRSANLGDSGFMVIRGLDIIYRSKEQQHAFNSPYQLGTGSTDRPEHATVTEVNVLPGDLVILGSDGLFDNLYDDEILELASKAHEPVTISQTIARQAYAVANDKSAMSPFSHLARQCGWPLAIGGKLDDITVVVARVVVDSEISPAA